MNRNDWTKTDKIGKTIAQTLPFITGLVIMYFIVNFLGIGDWVRDNSIWFITLLVVVLGIFINNLAEWIRETIKSHVDDDKEMLLEKLKELELGVDYIKNSIKGLKDN